MDENETPERTTEITSYIDVLTCLMKKLRSALGKIGLGENLEETLTNLKQQKVREIVKVSEAGISKDFFLQRYQLMSVSLEPPEEDSILFPRMSPQEESKQQKAQPPSLLLPETEDEEDVPTRSYLKRQAQLIVDAKSRRKFNRVLNFPKKK